MKIYVVGFVVVLAGGVVSAGDLSQVVGHYRYQDYAAGNPIVQSAKVLEAHFVSGKGYWVAQWPDMTYPVRANVTLVGGVLTSDSRFDDRSDALRYGSTERAVLRRVATQ
jgi:hypothetical protein